MDSNTLERLNVGSGSAARAIAVRHFDGATPGIFWLSGFKSDMKGTKAAALADWASAAGRACVRFDYSGHGESGGEFTDGTIGRWLEESRAVFDTYCRGPQIIVGSSMGGWLALLLARDLKRRPSWAAHLAGLILIAPAVDFTERLMWQKMTPDIRQEIETQGSWLRPSDYSEEPYVITRRLIEDGRKHLMLDGLIETGCPIRILQGKRDTDVPWEHAVELVSHLPQDDVVLTLIKDGDHRLSRPEDIAQLIKAVEEI